MFLKNAFNAYVKSFRGLPREAWLLSLVVLINFSGGMVIFFLPLYLTADRGFSILAAGRIISLWGFGSLFGSYAGGWLSDRWGSKTVQLVSLSLSGFGYVLLGRFGSPAAIAVLTFALSMVANVFRPANITAFTELCAGETQARGFALMRLAINLGFSIGPALGGVLAARNYQYIFWANGLTSLAAAAVLYRVFDDVPVKAKATRPAPSPGPVPSPWKDARLLRFLGLLFVVCVVFFQLFGTWPLYLKQVRGFSEGRIGLLLTINAVMIVLFEMQLIHRIEKKNPLSVISLGMAFVALGFALTPLAHGYGPTALTVVVWTVGEMLIFPISGAYIAGRTHAENSGTAMGLFSLTNSLAMMVGPVGGTWVYNRFGPQALWLGAGAVGFLAWAGMRWLGRSELPVEPAAGPALSEDG